MRGEDGSLALEVDPSGLPPAVTSKFPYLAGCTALRVTLGSGGAPPAEQLLAAQLAVAVSDAGGQALDATGLQLAGVLDDLYCYDGPLGASIGDSVDVALWAPTAQDVTLLVWDGPRSLSGKAPAEHAMARGSDGVWRFSDGSGWLRGKYYKYRLRVYCPSTRKVETVESTDPYSRSLAANGERTHVCDIGAAELKPQGWDEHAAPPLAAPTDISIYELHVRDFRYA